MWCGDRLDSECLCKMRSMRRRSPTKCSGMMCLNRVMKSLKYAVAIALGIAIGRFSAQTDQVNPLEWNMDFSTSGLFPMTNDDKHDGLNLPPVVLGQHDGFHPIHVYRGNSEVIKQLPKKEYEKGSQVDQDRVISALHRTYQTKYDKKNALLTSREGGDITNTKPYFVDLAANDAISLSNTLHLEEEGWDGLCVEPNDMYWYRLAHRKCITAAAFVGGKDDMQPIHVSLDNGVFGGIVGEEFDNKKGKTEKRYTVSLNTVFEQFAVPHDIDYMSLDVEGAEELIMKDFPFDSYKIKFMTIERPRPSLQALLKEHGYVFVMKLVYWGDTLWVHEDVIKNGFVLEEIKTVTHSNSQWSKKEPKKNDEVFDFETGTFERMK